jgi:phage-related protein
MRSNLSGDKIARALFYIDIRGRLVLLHGFIKKTQKTRNQIWNWHGRINALTRRNSRGGISDGKSNRGRSQRVILR